jgi:hypothetical protein
MTDYNIYSIRSYNNDKLVFYNYTKRKRIGDILSGLKTRYKRHLNNKDNWVNVFYILKQDNSYIKIEEHIVNSNDEIVKSRLCEIIADNKCINKMRNEDIEKLCNKTEPKNTENENQNKTEPTIEEVIIKSPINIEEPKIEQTIIEEVITEPKTEVIDNYFNTEPTNTETKIVKYINDDIADISNNQIELLNDTITEFNEPTNIVNEPTIIDKPTNNVKVVKNLADVKCIDNVYEPSITSSSRYSRPSFKQQIEQIKPTYNKTIKYNYTDVIKIINNKKTLKRHKEI